MKNSFKKNSLIVLLISIMSILLIGCGTGPDSGGMGSTSPNTSSSIK